MRLIGVLFECEWLWYIMNKRTLSVTALPKFKTRGYLNKSSGSALELAAQAEGASKCSAPVFTPVSATKKRRTREERLNTTKKKLFRDGETCLTSREAVAEVCNAAKSLEQVLREQKIIGPIGCLNKLLIAGSSEIENKAYIHKRTGSQSYAANECNSPKHQMLIKNTEAAIIKGGFIE